MIESFADRWAASLKAASRSHPIPHEHLKYAITVWLNMSGVVILCAIGGALLGTIRETFIALGAFVPLRIVSGGYHFKSIESCTLLSALLFLSIPYVPFFVDSLYISLIALMIVVWLAPRSTEKLRLSSKYYPAMKAASILVICLNFFLDSYIVALSHLIQAGLLTLVRKEG